MNIRIESATNGWIVKVGCVVLVYNNKDEIIADFVSWIHNPDETEKRFHEKYSKLLNIPRPGYTDEVGDEVAKEKEPGYVPGVGLGFPNRTRR